MVDTVEFMVTAAGLNALVDAQGGETDPIRIVALGITETAFDMAPTITNVPGELKRLETVSGIAASETTIHMTAQDVTADVYELRGLGLYLTDGTLFAVYSQATPLFRKVSISFFLLALDVAFSNGVAGDIAFGDTSFLMPPATRTVKGVAYLASEADADAGEDDSRIMTPALVRRLIEALQALVEADLSALADGMDAIIAALVARTITGGGLVSGGGNLTASRVLSVLAASVADVVAGTANDRAITPAALSGLDKYLGQDGYFLIPGGQGLMLQWGRLTSAANATSSATFPLAFPTACLSVVPAGGTGSGIDSQDNPPVLVESSITRFGFQVFSADDSSAGMRYIAIGN